MCDEILSLSSIPHRIILSEDDIPDLLPDDDRHSTPQTEKKTKNTEEKTKKDDPATRTEKKPKKDDPTSQTEKKPKKDPSSPKITSKKAVTKSIVGKFFSIPA
jgi:hypothetical protein